MLPFIHFGHLHLGRLDLPLTVNSFGLMLWLAAVVAAFVMDRSFRRARINADAIGMVAITVLAGMLGAKVWHVLDTPADFREMGWSVLWDSAGFAWFGGLSFGIAALIIQGIRARIGALRMLDLTSAAAAFGYGIGRLGCFLSGDGCYGIETKVPWGMSFPKGIVPVFERVHPTPLYELAGGLLIGTWLWFRGGKQRPTGSMLGEYLVLTGAARFLVEFLRRNPKVLLGLSNAQLASVGSMAAGVVLLLWAARRRSSRDAEPALAVEKPA